MDGILNLNKPTGMTSHDVVARVRRLLKTKRAGHAGTLDPDAVGVLVVAVGQATRLLPHLPTEPKEYIARLSLGRATTTEDASGAVTETSDVRALTEPQLQAVLPQFIGKISQIPPMVSAVHHAGKRLYELARQGIVVEREPRTVTIYQLTASEFVPGSEAEATLHITCGGGTYIRTLCVDIGKAMGVPAHMKALTREAVGPFRREASVTLEDLEAKREGVLLSAVGALPLPQYIVTEVQAQKIRHGMAISADLLRTEETVMLLYRERLIALAHYIDGELRPFKVFPESQDV